MTDRCSKHDTVLCQRFKIDGKWFLPTGEYYCAVCAEEHQADEDDHPCGGVR